jgi:hypothetical protein
MATTLKELADQRLTAAQNRLITSRRRSTAAGAAVDAAVGDLATATADLEGADKELAKVRAKLAEIPTSADATPLLKELEQATVDQRAAQAAMLAAERDLALARAQSERAAVAVREAEAGEREAKAAAAAAALEANRVAALVAALGEVPLDTLKSDAETLLDPTTAKAAKDAAEADIPDDLLKRARERVSIMRERMTKRTEIRDAFAKLIADQVAANGNTEDKLSDPRHKYAAAVAKLEDHVAHAGQRFQRASADLARLVDPAHEKVALTDEQKARLAELTTDGKAAAGLESTLDLARQTREAAELDLALVRAKHAADPAVGNDAVTNAEEAHDKAKEAEDDAKAAYITPGTGDTGTGTGDTGTSTGDTGAGTGDTGTSTGDTGSGATGTGTGANRSAKETMSLWEAAIPDPVWSDLADYDSACDNEHGVLVELANIVPGELAKAVTDAEKALVVELEKLDAERDAMAIYAANLAERTAACDFDAAAAARIALSALRGDAD